MPADPDVLVNGAEATENGVILDYDMAGECRVVGHDNTVADLAVMSDVGTDHKKAAVADPGDHAAAFGSGVYCHIFADRVVAPDHEFRLLAAIFQILRLEPDRGERKQAGTLSDRCSPIYHDVRAERDMRAAED